MKRRLLSFLSIALLGGVNSWAQTGFDLASEIQNASSGGTVQLTDNVKLTSTVTINKDLTIDLNGKTITGTDCRVFNIVAGDVKIINSNSVSKQISSTHTTGNTTFSDDSSVIRVGDGTKSEEFKETGRTKVSLTIGERVEVYTTYCYGIAVFGSKTEETLVVDGTVYVNGALKSAISGNGNAWYKGTTITIDKTGVVKSSKANAIYHPQDGVLNVYGQVALTGACGGIEAKAGTINIYDGAKVNGSSTASKRKHAANGNGCSTSGYSIAVVNNKGYAGGVKVNINNPSGEICYPMGIFDDSEDVAADKKGSITINHGFFKNYKPDESFLAEDRKIVNGKDCYSVADANTEIAATIAGKYEYLDIEKALSDWTGTLVLQKDVESRPFSVNGKTLTLDLNGHQWKAIYSEKQKDEQAFKIFNATNKTSSLTIKDSQSGGSIIGDDKILAAVVVGNGNTFNAGAAKLIVEGGKLKGKYYGVASNGQYKNTNITINGGELEGDIALYHPQDKGVLTINGGTLKGSCSAIEIRAGQQVDITGGTFVSTATTKSIDANGSGTTVTGYALAISQHTTKLPINVNVTGGTFNGINAMCVVNPQNNTTDNINITVDGGTFEATAANGEALYMAHKNGNLKVTNGMFKGTIVKEDGANLNIFGGTYTIKPNDNVIAEGFTTTPVEGSETTYQVGLSDFAAALNKAAAGTTIKLDKDISLTSQIEINNPNKITIDMNGHNITATNSRALHIKAGDVTIKNDVTKIETDYSGKPVEKVVGGVISSEKEKENESFKNSSSVIRVGDNDVAEGSIAKLTIEKGVKVFTKACYGVTVFGNKTKETLVVNGEVVYDGDEFIPAVSGNGSKGYEGTDITIGATGSVSSRGAVAIYHPQAGTLNVYGSVGVSYGGGIEAKSGEIFIYDGAMVQGSTSSNKIYKPKHEPNGNDPSTQGYSIAVVDHEGYAGNAKVVIDMKSGAIIKDMKVFDDNTNAEATDKKGRIVVKHGYFEKYKLDKDFVEEGKYLAIGGTYSWVLDSSADVVAKIGDNEYGNIQRAFDTSAWSTGKTLVLNKDIKLGSTKEVKNKYDLTLDLNGRKLSFGGSGPMFYVNKGGKLTINDSQANGKVGTLISGSSNFVVQVGTTNDKVTTPATLVVNGGKFTGGNFAISGNGQIHDTNIEINGGEFEAQVPVYHPQNGVLTINGGKFTGKLSGIEVRSGELNINGGEFISSSTASSVESNGSGTTTKGYAVAISQHATKHDINATISGGTFKGVMAVGVVNPQNNDTENVNVTISGGKFNGEIQAEHGKTKLLGGTYSVQPADKLIVEGFFASAKDDMFEVVKKIDMAVDESAEFKDENGEVLTDAAKTAAENAVAEVAKNEAVSNVEVNTEEAISKETAVGGKTLDKMIDDAIGEATDVKKEDITAVKTGIDIKLTSASVKTTGEDAATTTVVTKMVFDVKPVAVAFAGEKEVASVNVPNEMITQKIKFRLPVDKKATNKYVEISHKANAEAQTEDNLGLFLVQKDEKENKYVELERDNFSLYTMTLSNATSTMKVYRGNSEAVSIAMTAEKWANELDSYPNAIAIVSSSDDNKAFAKGEGVKNVLIEYDVDEYKSYVCPNFVLTDKENFYTPVDFTATTGSYSRTSNSYTDSEDEYNYNSVCLPFELKANTLSSTASLNTFSYYNGTDIVLFSKVNNVPAGTPCIVWEKKNTNWNVKFDKTNIVATPNNSGNMKGTFVNTTQYGKNGNESTDYYSVNTQNKFQYLESNLSPFRSCLWLHSDVEIEKDPQKNRMLRIVVDGEETTGIGSVQNNATTDNGVYTLKGVKVGTSMNNLPKGIYIHNGKKVVIK